MPITERLYFRQLVERSKQISLVLEGWSSGGKISLFVLPAAPGSGKSHFLWTIAARGALSVCSGSRHVLDPEWQEALEECPAAFRRELEAAIGITVSFNALADIDGTLEQKSSASTLIACRMLHSHFAATAWAGGKPVPYGEFLRFLLKRQLVSDDLTIERACDIIRSDAIAVGRNCPPFFILVVDELLKCEVLNGKRYSSMTAMVLQTLSTSMANGIRAVVSSLTPELSTRDKSNSDRAFTSLYLPQLNPITDSPRLIPDQIDSAAAAAIQKLLQHLAYQSVLQDTAGVPRLMEFVYQHAARWLEAGHAHAIKRESILEGLAFHPRLETYYRETSPIVRALEAIFLGWRMASQQQLKELGHERADLVRSGHLHLAQASAVPYLRAELAHKAFIIPPLLFHLWYRNDVARSLPVLRTILNFLYWDDPTTYSGEAFERQMIALWRLAYATDYIWRRTPIVTSQPACLRSAVIDLPSTVHSMLGCEWLQGESCFTPSSSTQALRDHARGIYPSETHSFESGADVKQFPVGLNVPKQRNHPGFDFLSVRITAEDQLRFYIAVEAKFTTGQTYIDGEAVANKLVLTLTSYLELLAAMCEQRFCFVLATFQVLAESHTPLSIAKIAHKELLSKNTAVKPSAEQIASSLVLLRRPHLEMLLTATLSSRSQFRRAVDQPELLELQHTLSRAYAEKQAALEKRGATGATSELAGADDESNSAARTKRQRT